jgi:hypothetical protein
MSPRTIFAHNYENSGQHDLKITPSEQSWFSQTPWIPNIQIDQHGTIPDNRDGIRAFVETR